MKKLLYTLLIINIVTIVIGFIATLFISILYSLIFIFFALLELVPLIAIINNIDSIENLYSEIYELKHRLKIYEDNNNEAKPKSNNTIQVVENRQAARGAWECVKCGTINKAGSDTCQNCKALYSPTINPTANPYEKKQVSRWIKDKKK